MMIKKGDAGMSGSELVKYEEIQSRIYTIRGLQVMIDRDLASLYDEEFSNWKSQIVMSNEDRMGLRRPPYAFTEQGVAMLSAVLRSETAVKVSIQIINAFVKMRRFIAANALIFQSNEGSVEYLIYPLEKDNDKFKKAALVLFRIITNHPFMDGNKRTAFEVADLLLRHEGLHIHSRDDEIINILIEIAKYKCPEERIIRWLKRNTRQLHSRE